MTKNNITWAADRNGMPMDVVSQLSGLNPRWCCERVSTSAHVEQYNSVHNSSTI